MFVVSGHDKGFGEQRSRHARAEKINHGKDKRGEKTNADNRAYDQALHHALASRAKR